MDRILLLHASVGMGHLRAASAIASAFQATGQVSTLIEDSLSYAPEVFRKIYSGLYLSISESAPAFWSFFYTQTERASMGRIDLVDPRLYGAAFGVGNLGAVLSHARPAAIVCTHFLPIEMITSLNYPHLPPIYCVLTDYHAHPFWRHAQVARYFVPTQDTEQQLTHAGIDKNRISVTGIPIHTIATHPSSQSEARTNLGLHPKRPVVLLILSGLTLSRARMIIEACLVARPLVTLLVAVGRNQTLASGLLDLEWRSGGMMRLIGTQANLDNHLIASDVVISKAGGLTLSEILAHGKPLLIPLPVPGQEEFNAQHAIQAGAALGCISADDFEHTLNRLLNHPTQRGDMAEAALSLAKPQAAQQIVDHVLSDLRVSV